MTGYCPDCRREWEALGEAHCALCCRHFTSDSAFDRHQVKGECVDPVTLTNRADEFVLQLTERASGPAWMLASDGDHHFARSRRAPEIPSATSREQNAALTRSEA